MPATTRMPPTAWGTRRSVRRRGRGSQRHGLTAADRARDEHLVGGSQALEGDRLDGGAGRADQVGARDAGEDAPVGGRSHERVALAEEDVAAAGLEHLAREVEDERLRARLDEGTVDPLVRAEPAGDQEHARLERAFRGGGGVMSDGGGRAGHELDAHAPAAGGRGAEFELRQLLAVELRDAGGEPAEVLVEKHGLAVDSEERLED